MAWPVWSKTEAAAYRHAKRYSLEPVPPQIEALYKYAVTIIPGRLYFARTAETDPTRLPYGKLLAEVAFARTRPADGSRHTPKPLLSPSFGVIDEGTERFHFTTDLALVYDGFCEDFGPLNLGQTYRFFKLLEGLMKDSTRPIVYYCSSVHGKAENAAYLIGAYMVIMRNMKPAQAIVPLMGIGKLEPFRDATWRCATYELRLYTCLEALETARNLGWFQYRFFDIVEYEKYEKVANGDLNWIIPRKFLAFAGPERDGNRPEKFIPIFKSFGVTLVIRLNKKQYNRKTFAKSGINHVDLFFVDGSCPSLDIVHSFLQVCEQEKGAIAVHCKAGLGRTGTLLGCYAMKHYGFEPGQWIAWNRICRPGSILGPQQHFLHYIYSEGLLHGDEAGQERVVSGSSIISSSTVNTSPRKVVLPVIAFARSSGSIPLEAERSPTKMTDTANMRDAVMMSEPLNRGLSPKEAEVAEKGDHGQGERLVSVKNRSAAVDNLQQHNNRVRGGRGPKPVSSPRHHYRHSTPTGEASASPSSPGTNASTTTGGGLSPVQSMKRLANYFSSRTSSPVRTR